MTHRTLRWAIPCIAALGAATASAQTLEIRPGLWADAHLTTINGKKTPSILDIKGALKPADRAAIESAMQKIGLPAGWSPAMSCAANGTYDPATIARGASTGACTVTVTEQRRDGARFTVACTGELTGRGQGHVSITDKAQAETAFSMDATYKGQPIKFEQKGLSKWIGADCEHPPAGIDASWMRLGSPQS